MQIVETLFFYPHLCLKLMIMKPFRNHCLLPITLAILIVCSSWGFLMHRTLTQLSVYALPKEMRPFFHQNIDYLVRHSVRPDQRRNSDSSEDTKHFIDLEAYGKEAANKMPAKWEDAVALYSKDSLEK